MKPRAPLYPPCEPRRLTTALCETDGVTTIRDEAVPLEGTAVRSFSTTAVTSASDPHPADANSAGPPACGQNDGTLLGPQNTEDNLDNGLRPERSPASPANLNVREMRSLTTANTSASDPHPAVSMAVDCAAREALEECGYDCGDKILIGNNVLVNYTKETNRSVRLFIVPTVPKSTVFETQTREEISTIEWFPVASDLKKSNDVLPFMSRLRKWIKEHKRTLPRANSVPRQQVAKPRARPARVSCPAVAASAARPCVVLNTWYYVTTTLTLSLPHPSGAAAASRKICQITNTKPKGASSWCHARASDSTSARPAATAILPALPSLATFSRVRVYALNIAITAPHLSPLPPTPPFALHLNHDPSNDG